MLRNEALLSLREALLNDVGIDEKNGNDSDIELSAPTQ